MTSYNAFTKTWSGPRIESPFPPTTSVGQAICTVLAKTPTKVSQICDSDGRVLTCEDLRLRTIRVAQHLTALGYKPGDMIAVVAGHSTNLSPVIFGCFLAGFVVNTVDKRLDAHDMSHLLRLTEPVLVLCDEAVLGTAQVAIAEAKITARVMILTEDLALPTGTEDRFQAPSVPDSKVTLAAVITSSGSTGLPKPICLSHAQLINLTCSLITNDQSFYSTADNDREDDRAILLTSQLHWISGYMMLLGGLMSGIRRIITSHRYEADLALKLVEKYGVTHVLAPPPLALELVQRQRLAGYDLSSLRYFLCGGTTVPDWLRDDIDGVLPNGRCYVGYGMSETGAGAMAVEKVIRRGTVGELEANIEMRVINPCDGTLLGPSQPGELLARYRYPFLGYFHQEKATAEILRQEDNFLHTGDIGFIDSCGFVTLQDRLKEIICWGFYQISPSEMEGIIGQLEGVRQVVVVGIATVEQLDLVTAMVVRGDDQLQEEDVVRFVEGRVCDFKRLRGGVFFVEELPVTNTGKVRRAQVRKMAVRMYEERHGSLKH
ncbi:AMP dependent ligase [Culex quinquefasciatus]|uniref:AMP dependent ligase n=1 Tax=Culex quinquefasciatus TaxID=7176 RepID=B0X7Q5_CULQU|nr:AMP dependent ligase [Culex quinquefasciatus]|eukprot:XP_001865677.1 AMP dependent ligase [Culex quinquefasciatus]